MSLGKRLKFIIVKFTTDIALERINGLVKLSLDEFMKFFKIEKGVKFVFERVDPHIMSEIIDEDHIIFVAIFA